MVSFGSINHKHCSSGTFNYLTLVELRLVSLNWIRPRWNIEVTFEELRTHSGMETRRHWSERAIARTTPALFALFSLVTLNIIKGGRLPVQQATWHRK